METVAVTGGKTGPIPAAAPTTEAPRVILKRPCNAVEYLPLF